MVLVYFYLMKTGPRVGCGGARSRPLESHRPRVLIQIFEL